MTRRTLLQRLLACVALPFVGKSVAEAAEATAAVTGEVKPPSHLTIAECVGEFTSEIDYNVVDEWVDKISRVNASPVVLTVNGLPQTLKTGTLMLTSLCRDHQKAQATFAHMARGWNIVWHHDGCIRHAAVYVETEFPPLATNTIRFQHTAMVVPVNPSAPRPPAHSG